MNKIRLVISVIALLQTSLLFSQLVDEISIFGGFGRSNNHWKHGLNEARDGFKEAITTSNVFFSIDKNLGKKIAIQLDVGLDQSGYQEHITSSDFSDFNGDFVDGNFKLRLNRFSSYLSVKINPFKKAGRPSFYIGFGANRIIQIGKRFIGISELDFSSNFDDKVEDLLFDRHQFHTNQINPFIFSGLIGIRQEFNKRFYYRLEWTNSINDNYMSIVRGRSFELRLLAGLILFNKNKKDIEDNE